MRVTVCRLGRMLYHLPMDANSSTDLYSVDVDEIALGSKQPSHFLEYWKQGQYLYGAAKLKTN